MKFRKVILLLIFIFPIILSGCVDSREINTLGITIAMGLDKTPSGYLMTQQVLIPSAITAKRSINESPVILYTEEGNNLFDIKRRITTQSPRRIYNSHLRMVVLSEEVAKEDLKDIIDFLERDHEYRTDFYFAIAKGTSANKVISILSPLETTPGVEMYDSLKTSEESWGSTKSVRITELINSLISEGKNPVITGVTITNGISNSNSIDALKTSNEIKKVKYDGLGVFKRDKLVGYLNEDESKGYNFIIGNHKNSSGSASYDRSVITFETINAKSKIEAYMIDNKPAINITIDLTANVVAVAGNLDVSKEENAELLSNISAEGIQTICNKSVNKAKELGADIFGFGEAIHRRYPKLWKSIKSNWDSEFQNIPVTITVNSKIKQLGEITKPLFSEEE